MKPQKILDVLTEQEEEEKEKNSSEAKKAAKAKAKKKKQRSRKAGGKKRRKKSSSKKKKKKVEFEIEPFPETLSSELAVVKADLKIREEKYEEAIEHLQTAIDLTKKKKQKTRLLFILAQLYQAVDDKANASTTYGLVIKSHPEYEMEFYARINRALNVNVRSKDLKSIKSELEKMLKDEKNKQYYDQIYFALAEIELKERNQEQGIEYLVLSTEASIENPRQKGLSFMKLGDIHFRKKAYTAAQAYYDSTTTYLPQTHEQFETIKNRSEYLTELVGYLNTIAFEDSVQQLAKLDPKELNAVIDDLIDTEREAIERQKEEDELNRLNGVVTQKPTTTQNQSSGGSNWYFYNQGAKSFWFWGFQEDLGRSEVRG